MKNLSVQIKKDHGQQIPYVDSRDVAKVIEKKHFHLVRDIDMYIQYMNNSQGNSLNPKMDSVPNPTDYFIESSYKDKSGKKNKCYLLTRKGCEFVANKMTGEKGTIFTANYIDKFHEMEEILARQQLPEWKKARNDGKTTRNIFTDTISKLVEYAVNKGAKEGFANQLYWRMTKALNNALCIEIYKSKIPTRDRLDVTTTIQIAFFENEARRVIEEGITLNRPYDEFLPKVEAKFYSFLDVMGYPIPKPTTKTYTNILVERNKTFVTKQQQQAQLQQLKQIT